MTTNETPVILGPDSKPARRAKHQDDRCPGKDGQPCGAGKDKRVPSTGFGQEPYPICAACGHEFVGERWHG